jgi:hypothetical protein
MADGIRVAHEAKQTSHSQGIRRRDLIHGERRACQSIDHQIVHQPFSPHALIAHTGDGSARQNPAMAPESQPRLQRYPLGRNDKLAPLAADGRFTQPARHTALAWQRRPCATQ